MGLCSGPSTVYCVCSGCCMHLHVLEFIFPYSGNNAHVSCTKIRQLGAPSTDCSEVGSTTRIYQEASPPYEAPPCVGCLWQTSAPSDAWAGVQEVPIPTSSPIPYQTFRKSYKWLVNIWKSDKHFSCPRNANHNDIWWVLLIWDSARFYMRQSFKMLTPKKRVCPSNTNSHAHLVSKNITPKVLWYPYQHHWLR